MSRSVVSSVIIIIPVVLVLALFAGAVLLRASVSFSNKILKPQHIEHTQPSPQLTSNEASEFQIDTSNPYAAPSSAGASNLRITLAIPEPNFPKACMIVFVNGLIGGLISLGPNLVFQGSPDLVMIGGLVNLVIGFVVTTVVYALMLPTTFGRAAMVYFMTLLIVIAISVMTAGLVFTTMAFFG